MIVTSGGTLRDYLIRGVKTEIMSKTTYFLAVLTALVVSSQANCEEASLKELERRCQEARESKLAPLREAAIEECASQRRSSRTREDCERLESDSGERAGRRPAMFIDLPECIEYFEARDRQESSRSRH